MESGIVVKFEFKGHSVKPVSAAFLILILAEMSRFCHAGAASQEMKVLERGEEFIRVQFVNRSGDGATNTYTLLENGLHYRDGGQWRLSEDLIESSPIGPVARRGPHKAVFSQDLNDPSSFEIQGADGTRLRGGVRSIILTDSAKGMSVQLAAVRQSVPAELDPPNRVIYRDAFEGGARSDVVMIWRHNYFAQEVVLRSRVRLPKSYCPETTRLEIHTELIDPPPAQVTERRTAEGLDDHSFIRLGGLALPPGRAITVDESCGASLGGPSPRTEGVLIGKRWDRRPDGGTFLVESVPWIELEAMSQGLPEAAMPDAPDWTNPQGQTLAAISTSKAPYHAVGVAADFVVIPDQGSPTTFRAGQTHVVRRSFYVGGAAVFEPGCVIKNHGQGSIVLHGRSISFPSTGAPCVFTSIDDDLYGDKVMGSGFVPNSDGNPEDNRIDDALRIWDVNYSTLVQNAVFRWAAAGIEYFRTGPAADHRISHCRFEHISYFGLYPAIQVFIDPARTVAFQNSTKCNVDWDYARYQGAGVNGALLADCSVADATALEGHEIEPAIVVRQISPAQTRVVIVAIYRRSENGLMRSISNDGGTTWSRSVIADGAFKEADGVTPMIRGLADPTMAYDDFGNLFLAYNGLIGDEPVIPLYVSTDHGETFARVPSFTIYDPERDLPRLAAGPAGRANTASVWISYRGRLGARARGVLVHGPGAANIDSASNDRVIPFGFYSKLTVPQWVRTASWR